MSSIRRKVFLRNNITNKYVEDDRKENEVCRSNPRNLIEDKMEEKKSAKERVIEKMNIAMDIKNNAIKKSIERIQQIDGKIIANFEVSGLPAKEKSSGLVSHNDSYKTIKKIFNDLGEFSEYAEGFFNKSDEEIISFIKK